jgi:hypothetical protein
LPNPASINPFLTTFWKSGSRSFNKLVLAFFSTSNFCICSLVSLGFSPSFGDFLPSFICLSNLSNSPVNLVTCDFNLASSVMGFLSKGISLSLTLVSSFLSDIKSCNSESGFKVLLFFCVCFLSSISLLSKSILF